MIILQYARQKGIKFGFKGLKIEDEEDKVQKPCSVNLSGACLKLVEYDEINMDQVQDQNKRLYKQNYEN